MNWLLYFNSHAVPQPHFLKPAGSNNGLRLGTVSSEYEPHQRGKDSTDVTFGVFILHLCPSAVCSTKTSELEHFVFSPHLHVELWGTIEQQIYCHKTLHRYLWSLEDWSYPLSYLLPTPHLAPKHVQVVIYLDEHLLNHVWNYSRGQETQQKHNLHNMDLSCILGGPVMISFPLTQAGISFLYQDGDPAKDIQYTSVL